MPHLILEFSSNVKEKNTSQDLFKKFHYILEKMLPTDLDSCKSRVIECNTFFVGDGQPNNAFIHLTVKVMPGRSQETLKKLGNAMMDQLKDYFSTSLKHLKVQMSLEIIELQTTYFK